MTREELKDAIDQNYDRDNSQSGIPSLDSAQYVHPMARKASLIAIVGRVPALKIQSRNQSNPGRQIRCEKSQREWIDRTRWNELTSSARRRAATSRATSSSPI
jgi:hypothetical protein